MLKFELIRIENKKQVVILTNRCKNDVIKKLLYYLWLTKVNQVKYIKMKYTYNYTDSQTIEFVDTSSKTQTYIYKFSNIPTNWGILNIDKL